MGFQTWDDVPKYHRTSLGPPKNRGLNLWGNGLSFARIKKGWWEIQNRYRWGPLENSILTMMWIALGVVHWFHGNACENHIQCPGHFRNTQQSCTEQSFFHTTSFNHNIIRINSFVSILHEGDCAVRNQRQSVANPITWLDAAKSKQTPLRCTSAHETAQKMIRIMLFRVGDSHKIALSLAQFVAALEYQLCTVWSRRHHCD